MKITVIQGLNPIEVIRRAGYGQVMDRRAAEPSWARRLGSGVYPRFHVYISGDQINLHLDQKQASYEGFNAHSGEYDGAAVEAESERIINIMSGLSCDREPVAPVSSEKPKSGLFGRFFGV